jgi:hypothetical protein
LANSSLRSRTLVCRRRFVDALLEASEFPSSERVSRSDSELERVRVTRARQPGDLWTLFCDAVHYQTLAAQRVILPNENID